MESNSGSPVELSSPSSAAVGLGPASRVFSIFLCGVLAFLDLYSTQPLLPLFEQLFHAGEAAVGLTVSAATLGVALTAPLLGLFAERLSRKRIIVLSSSMLAIPTLLAATAPSLHALIFWRFLQGILIPGIFAIAISYVTEEWPSRSVPLAMSFYVSGTALGGCLGRVLMGLITASFGWRSGFVVLALVTLAGSGAVARLLPRETLRVVAKQDSTATIREFFAPMFGHFRNPRLLATYLIGFNVLFSLVAMLTYVTFYLAAPPFLLSTGPLSYLFLVYLIALVSTPAAGAVLHVTGLRYGVIAAGIISLAGVLITLFRSLPIIVLGLAICCIGVFISQACATSYLHQATPFGGRLSAVGLYIAFYYVGGTVGGVAPSYMWRWGGWPACVLLVVLVDFLTIAVAMIGWTGNGRNQAPEMASVSQT